MDLFDETGNCDQAYIKAVIYSGPGGGKTYTALKMLTSLGKTLIIDTERGCEPYRNKFSNPDGSPFIVSRTRSAKVITNQVIPGALKRGVKCLILDVVSTVWLDCQELYQKKAYTENGKAWQYILKHGRYPFQAWGFIKGPYKKMLRELLNTPMHVFILGRATDDFMVGGDGVPVRVGDKMVCEKDTPYEPALKMKMEFIKGKGHSLLVEKDRWGQLEGSLFYNPDVNILEPILRELGDTHGRMPEPEGELDGSEEEMDNNGQDIEPLQPSKVIIFTKLFNKKKENEPELLAKLLGSLSNVQVATLIKEMTLGNYENIK